MAATFGAVATASGSSAAPAVNAPAGDNTGKLLVANVRGSSVGTSVAGWNYLNATNWWFNGSSMRSWWRIGDGTSADNFATTSSDATWEASIVRVEGADTDSPISDYTSGAVGNPSGATFDLPDETVAADGSLAITFAASNGSNDNTPTTIPGSYTVRASEGSRSYFVATSPVNTGTGGGGTWAMSGGVRYGGQVVIVNPADSEPPEPNPGIDTMVAEDFAGGIPEWLLVDPRGDGDQDNVDVDNGVLRIGYATGSFDDGVVVTTGEFERCDLTGRRVVFDVELLHRGLIELYSGVQFAVGDTDSVGFRVYRTGSDLVVDWWEYVESEEIFDGGTLDTRTYSTTSHRYLSIRESSGTVYVEASPDNATWTTLASRAISEMASFDAEAVQVAFYGTTDTHDTGGIYLAAINPAADDDNTGELAATLGVTCSGAGALAIAGAVATTIGVACSAVGALGVSAALAATVPVTASGTATLPIVGSVASSIPVACSGLGSSDRVASGAITIGVTCTGTGSLDLVGAGTGSIPVTASGSATLDITATGAVGIAVTAAGTGALEITGAGDITIAVVCSGVGSLIAEGSGALAATIAVTCSGSAQLEISGAGSAVVGVVAQGSAALAISGTAASTIPVTCSGTGSLVSPGSGALSATIPVVAEGSGSLAISGQGEASVPVVVVGAGSLAISGTGTATVGVTCTGVGSLTEATHTGTLAVTIPVTAIGTGALDITGHLAASIHVTCIGAGADPDSALAPFPRERRFTAITRTHQFESLVQTHSFRATVRSHTLEVPSD